MTSHAISTWTGRTVYLLRPDPGVVDIHDIARSLSQQARYLGHTTAPYSVAQHAVILSHLCDPEHRLAALLHDAAETYLGDLAGPIKDLPGLVAYRMLEATWLVVIFQALGLPPGVPDQVQQLDRQLRINEVRDLFAEVPVWAQEGTPLELQSRTIRPWPWVEAERAFLRRFDSLTGGTPGATRGSTHGI